MKSPDPVESLRDFCCLGDINIAFPILLVNRKSDLNIEKPIFFIFNYALIDKRKPDTGSGCLEFVKMKVIQNRKEWRYETVLELTKSGASPEDAIHGTKEIEKYVFQDELIVNVSDPKKKEALKKFIESIQED